MVASVKRRNIGRLVSVGTIGREGTDLKQKISNLLKSLRNTLRKRGKRPAFI
jgi:hypothetical protein